MNPLSRELLMIIQKLNHDILARELLSTDWMNIVSRLSIDEASACIVRAEDECR